MKAVAKQGVTQSPHCLLSERSERHVPWCDETEATTELSFHYRTLHLSWECPSLSVENCLIEKYPCGRETLVAGFWVILKCWLMPNFFGKLAGLFEVSVCKWCIRRYIKLGVFLVHLPVHYILSGLLGVSIIGISHSVFPWILFNSMFHARNHLIQYLHILYMLVCEIMLEQIMFQWNNHYAEIDWSPNHLSQSLN